MIKGIVSVSSVVVTLVVLAALVWAVGMVAVGIARFIEARRRLREINRADRSKDLSQYLDPPTGKR